MIDMLENQITIDQWLQDDPEHAHVVVAANVRDGWRQPPSCDQCDVAFGSLICFERRGYFYLRARHEWLKGRDGKPMISEKNRICKKRFTEEEK